MTPSTPRTRRRSGALLLAAALIAAAQAAALQIPEEFKKKFLGGDFDLKTEMSPENTMQSSIDNSIDPETYMVGGGDGFFISIVGLPSQKYTPVVGADGNIYEGDLGVIKLGRIPLRQAVDTISKHVRRILKRDYQIHVILTRVKTPVVNVNGAVDNPGTFSAPGTRRLLDVIKMANNNLIPSLQKADLRQVAVKGLDSTRTYDLLRYFSGGDLSQNPYIYPGENITVPATDARAYVTGEIVGPVSGWVPVKPGETVGAFLGILRAKGTADTKRVILQRAAKDAGAAAISLPIDQAAGMPLRDGDLLTVPMAENRRLLDTAVVSGEVMWPGAYPISVGVTTAEELLRQAGGPSALANPGRAYLLRVSKIEAANRNLLDETDKAGALMRRQASMYVQAVRPELGSSFAEMKANGDFAVIELGENAGSIRVEEGDRLYVPRKEQFVYVSGSVENPGAYAFKAGEDYYYYVRKAGGYSVRADRKNKFVVGLYDGATKIKDVDQLREGDVLVVPSSIEYKTVQAVIMPSIQAAIGILGLVVSILILNK